jgi:hypothetical protein
MSRTLSRAFPTLNIAGSVKMPERTKLMSNEKNQPAEESVETTTSIAPQDAKATSSELNKDETDQVAAGFMIPRF